METNLTPQPNEPTAEAICKAAILIIRAELRNEGEGTLEEMQEAYDENEWYLNESKRVESIIESMVAAPLRASLATAESQVKLAVDALEVCGHVLLAQRVSGAETHDHYKLMAARLMDEHVGPVLAQLREAPTQPPAAEVKAEEAK